MNCSLPEQLVLLSLNQHTGKRSLRSSRLLKYGVVSALLFELEQRGKITFIGEKLSVKDEILTGAPYPDKLLTRLIEIKKDKKLNYWISKLLPEGKKIVEELYADLAKKGAIRLKRNEDGAEIPGRYDIWNEMPLRRTKSHLDAFLLGHKKPESEEEVLVSLVWACRIVDNIYENRPDRSKAKQQAEIIGDENPYGLHIRKCVNAKRWNALSGLFSFTVPVVTEIF